MRELLFSIYHHDCTGCMVSERFPEVRVDVSPIIYQVKRDDGGIFSAIWKFSGRRIDEVREAVKFVRDLKSTKKTRFVERSDSNMTIYMTVEAPHTAVDRIMANSCIPLRSVYVEGGLEHWHVLTEKVKNVSKLVDSLSEIGEVRIQRIRNYKRAKKIMGLTEKQLEALRIAFDNGYYKWPKRSNLEEIALKAGVGRTTFQAHLRKAEGKVIGRFMEDFEKRCYSFLGPPTGI